MQNIELKSDSTIYVICPANNKTGGTELLHQLTHKLNEIGRKAFITYYLEGNCNRKSFTPEEFRKYVTHSCMMNEVIDEPQNVIILPEVCIGKHRKFRYIQKCIWWLSVDNYINSYGRLSRLKKYGFLSFCKHLILNDFNYDSDINKVEAHLCQSNYAISFVISKGIEQNRIFYLSDYINDIYYQNYDAGKKQDIVLYNPKKGIEFTKQLIERSPDIRWIAIQNMNNDQVLKVLQKAKVYVDFGNHPGKDRIPREAALAGCCILTNRRGSAAYRADVPIIEKYKFDDNFENIDKIIARIRECFRYYSELVEDFENYRDIIKNEKEKFEEDVKNIFG